MIFLWTFVTCAIMIPVVIDFKAPCCVPFLVISAIVFFWRMIEATVDWITGRWGQ